MAIKIGDVVRVKGDDEIGRVCHITPAMTYKITFDGQTLVSEQEKNLEHAYGDAPTCPKE